MTKCTWEIMLNRHTYQIIRVEAIPVKPENGCASSLNL